MCIETLILSIRERDEIVLSDADCSLTGSEFFDMVLESSRILEANNIQKGTHVLLNMSSDVESVVTLFSLWKKGALVFISNPFNPVGRILETVDKFNIQAFVANKAIVKAFESCHKPRNTEKTLPSFSLINKLLVKPISTSIERGLPMLNAAVAIFSSGSTGKPKAIIHSFDSIYRNATCHAESIGLRGSDVVGCALPLFYSYGLVASLLGAFASKACVVLSKGNGGVDSEWVSKNNISVIGLTPFFAKSLLITSPSLRTITLGGDALHINTAKKIRRNYPSCELYSTYGLTEAGPRVATWRFDNIELPETNIAPLGTPLSCCDFYLQDVSGKHLNSKILVSNGELIVKTNTRMLGYYSGHDLTMPAWNEEEVNTGDIFQNVGGEFFFVARDKDIIVQNGEKIFPSIVESVLLTIDSILDARVVGVVDDDKGEIAEAFIHSNGQLNVNDIKRSLLNLLPRSSIPTNFHFVEEIKRTITGKNTNKESFRESCKELML